MRKFLNLAEIRECTESEGPGKRFALWCQGCKKRCPGCCNTHMQPFEKRYIVTSADVIELISRSLKENNIEGVSFIGGEPMLQAQGLSEVAKWCHENKLTVLVFTGYLLEELKAADDKDINTLLNNTDLLIDGPYVQEQYDTERDWIGSKNQRIHFLSNKYEPGIEKNSSKHSVEFIVSDTEVQVNGWPIKI